MTQTYPCLIDGELVTTDATLEVLNPANEQVVGLVPVPGEEPSGAPQMGPAAAHERIESPCHLSDGGLALRHEYLHTCYDAVGPAWGLVATSGVAQVELRQRLRPRHHPTGDLQDRVLVGVDAPPDEGDLRTLDLQGSDV